MGTCLIYEQMCKLTSFVKHLQPGFVKYQRKYPLICIEGSKFRDMGFWHYGAPLRQKVFKKFQIFISTFYFL